MTGCSHFATKWQGIEQQRCRICVRNIVLILRLQGKWWDLQSCIKPDHRGRWLKWLLAISYSTYRCACTASSAGVTVLFGAGFFATNRVNIRKFLVIVGTGQGLFTITIRILSEIWTGQTWATDSYITWLTSSAAGLAILFAVLSQSISKRKGQTLSSKAFRFALRRWINSND